MTRSRNRPAMPPELEPLSALSRRWARTCAQIGLERDKLALRLRNTLSAADNHGALQLSWRFPLYGRLKD